MEIIPNWHPIFVHFTVALLTVSVVLYMVGSFINNTDLKNQLLTVARWNLWLGTAFTVITVLTGWYAYNTVAHDEPSHLAMTDHRNWALVTASVFFIFTLWSVWAHVKAKNLSLWLVAGLLMALTLLGSTAWRGGEIVYRYGLGVMSLPVVNVNNADGHDHSHNDEHGDMHQETAPIKVPENNTKKNTGHEGHKH